MSEADFYREFSKNTFWYIKSHFNEKSWIEFIESQDYIDYICKNTSITGAKFRIMKEIDGEYRPEDLPTETFPSTLTKMEIFIRICKLLSIFYKQYKKFGRSFPNFLYHYVIDNVVYLSTEGGTMYHMLQELCGPRSARYHVWNEKYEEKHEDLDGNEADTIINKCIRDISITPFDTKKISKFIKEMVHKLEAL
jgi:hypothetical protein